MSDTKFTRKIEDFTCKNCGYTVKGSGYTNHCPKCLWSRHVDINPGDRKNDCKGMMKPVGLEIKNGETRIIHKCVKCGTKVKNRTASDDDQSVLLDISINPVI